jgi:hypothetical protein
VLAGIATVWVSVFLWFSFCRASEAKKPAENRTGPMIHKKGSMPNLHWVHHDVEQELLELDDFCPDAAASFPPSVGVKT